MSGEGEVDELIDAVYWSALDRAPDAKEKEVATAFLKEAPPPATTQPIHFVSPEK